MPKDTMKNMEKDAPNVQAAIQAIKKNQSWEDQRIKQSMMSGQKRWTQLIGNTDL